MTDSRQLILAVPPEIGRVRLDRFLVDHPDLSLSRNRVQQLIASGAIRIDGRLVPKSLVLGGGETITIDIPHIEESVSGGEDIPLDIIYEDDHLAIVNKSAGMVTHPAVGHRSGTLVNALLYRYGNLPGAHPERAGIVHRLDKMTSGLLIVARTSDMLAQLQAMIASRTISREYSALVWGHVREEKGMIDAPIGRSERDRKKMGISAGGGREARTEYELEERFLFLDLLAVRLHTGRTHQIRVHLAHIGHPVFGDTEYGGRNSQLKGLFGPHRPTAIAMLTLIDHQALHARHLTFQHPVRQERMVFEAPLPDDFLALLKEARKNAL